MSDGSDEWEDYESGPFCVHWSDTDCEEKCYECGHRCVRHGMGHEECDECECPKWRDKP